jgi:hypothetical protein
MHFIINDSLGKYITSLKNELISRYQLLMPVILATQEAKNKIMVQSQTGQIICEILYPAQKEVLAEWPEW